MGFVATMPIISGWRFEEEAYQEELNHYETLGAHVLIAMLSLMLILTSTNNSLRSDKVL